MTDDAVKTRAQEVLKKIVLQQADRNVKAAINAGFFACIDVDWHEAIRAMIAFATAEAASGAGERDVGKAYNGGRCPDCDDTGDITRLDGERLGTCHCAAVLPSATAPAMVTVPRALLAPFAAVADEWDRWQAKGSTSTPKMLITSYGRVRFGLSEYQAVRAALAAAPTIQAAEAAA